MWNTLRNITQPVSLTGKFSAHESQIGIPRAAPWVLRSLNVILTTSLVIISLTIVDFLTGLHALQGQPLPSQSAVQPVEGAQTDASGAGPLLESLSLPAGMSRSAAESLMMRSLPLMIADVKQGRTDANKIRSVIAALELVPYPRQRSALAAALRSNMTELIRNFRQSTREAIDRVEVVDIEQRGVIVLNPSQLMVREFYSRDESLLRVIDFPSREESRLPLYMQLISKEELEAFIERVKSEKQSASETAAPTNANAEISKLAAGDNVPPTEDDSTKRGAIVVSDDEIEARLLKEFPLYIVKEDSINESVVEKIEEYQRVFLSVARGRAIITMRRTQLDEVVQMASRANQTRESLNAAETELAAFLPKIQNATTWDEVLGLSQALGAMTIGASVKASEGLALTNIAPVVPDSASNAEVKKPEAIIEQAPADDDTESQEDWFPSVIFEIRNSNIYLTLSTDRPIASILSQEPFIKGVEEIMAEPAMVMNSEDEALEVESRNELTNIIAEIEALIEPVQKHIIVPRF